MSIDDINIDKLDKEGMNLSRRLREELPDSSIEYFPNAVMKKLQFD